MADISKIKVNSGEALNLKDAQGRADMTTLLGGHTLQGLGDAAFKGVAAGITSTEAGLATGKQVYDAIADLEGGVRFRGIVTREEGETDIQAITRQIENPKQGDLVLMQDNKKEYIYDGTNWQELGDEEIYLTKAAAASTYTPMTRTIAGVDLKDDITAAEMKTALDLKALSHKDNASGTVTTVDSATVVAGKSGEYNVTAQTVAIPDTYNAMDVTPAGTVGVTKTAGASVSYNEINTITLASKVAGEEEVANYVPAGSVSKPSITANLSLAEGSVATVTSEGTGYTISDGNVTKADDSKSTFAKTGLVAALDKTDTEMLVFTDATTADAVTASGAITYTKQTISGSLPTFGTKDVVIKTGSTASASLDAAPAFTGTGAILSASASEKVSSATVTDAVYSASFTGTEASVTPTVKTTTDASVTQGTVTVASDTFTVALTNSAKTVTVQ